MTRRLAGAIAASFAIALAVPASTQALTIDVSTTADEYLAGSACSLREAIESANTDAAVGGCSAGEATSPDEVRLPAGTFMLTRPGAAGQTEAATATPETETAEG